MVSHLKWLTAFCLSFLLSLNIFAQSLTNPAPVKFETEKIKLNSKKVLTVEIAKNEQQHSYGLMNRKSLPTDHGMLFVFSDEQIRTFWMKNTLMDLSIGYFDKDKQLIDIQEMKAPASIMQEDLPVYPSKKPAMYALEMPPQWFTKNKIVLGNKFEFTK